MGEWDWDREILDVFPFSYWTANSIRVSSLEELVPCDLIEKICDGNISIIQVSYTKNFHEEKGEEYACHF